MDCSLLAGSKVGAGQIMQAMMEHAIEQLSRSQSFGHCKICNGATEAFDVVDLNKTCNIDMYPRGLCGTPIVYMQCRECGFIFTTFFDEFSDEQWRKTIYNDEYSEVDPDYLVRRPQENSRHIRCLLFGRRHQTIGLDYGGGNGLTARLLRARGWTFDCIDPFGDTSLSPDHRGRYDFCSALEVFEHLPKPHAALSAIMNLVSPHRFILLIGTSIHDRDVTRESRLAWSYAAPRNGHISLYSRESLKIMAARHGLDYFSISNGTHLLTRDIKRVEALTRLWRGKALLKVSSVLKFK